MESTVAVGDTIIIKTKNNLEAKVISVLQNSVVVEYYKENEGFERTVVANKNYTIKKR